MPWNTFTRPQKIQMAHDAISYLREAAKDKRFPEIYIPERDQHYPIQGLIAWWMEVLEELDNETPI